jgi:hypothetical protein
MINYELLLNELTKYGEIINLVRHINVKKGSGKAIDFELSQLKNCIDECELTTKRIAGTEAVPLSSAVSMFEQNFSEDLIRSVIETALNYQSDMLTRIQQHLSKK